MKSDNSPPCHLNDRNVGTLVMDGNNARYWLTELRYVLHLRYQQLKPEDFTYADEPLVGPLYEDGR